MSIINEKFTEFMYEFHVPTQDFLKTELKELKISMEFKKKEMDKYNTEENKGKYSFQDIYFVLIIPDYIYQFVKNKTEEYSKEGLGLQGHYETGKAIYDKNYNFIKSIRNESFNNVIKQFQKIVLDALHFKELEQLEKNNKVIFINCNFSMTQEWEDYNFAYIGNKLNLNFQYFVAYKVYKRKNMIVHHWQNQGETDDEVIEYYGIKRRDTFCNNHQGRLPYLRGHEIKNFKEIEWTQERENFFAEIERQIKVLSEKVSGFVKDIDHNNIDAKIIEHKNTLRLGYDENDRNKTI